MIIRYKGKEPGAPPADTHWQPGEKREVTDRDEAARLLQHPDFVEVKPPAPKDATDQEAVQDQFPVGGSEEVSGAH